MNLNLYLVKGIIDLAFWEQNGFVLVDYKTDATKDMQLLADGLKLLQMDYLGGHGSRGYGRVSFRDFELSFFSLNEEYIQEFASIQSEFEEILKGCCLI